MKTIKIIDLIINIAEKRQNPSKIRYDNDVWCVRASGDYTKINDDENEDYYLFDDKLCFCYDTLNTEVEILEEAKEIKKLDKSKFYDNRFPDAWEEEVINRIDKLIDVVNELNKNK